MSDKTFEVTSTNFESDVLKADQPVLVDFWADWCAPCKMLAPVLDEIASDNAAQLNVGKLDADQHQDLVMRYQVMGLPTLILFKNGEPVERITGFQSKEKILAKLNPHLS